MIADLENLRIIIFDSIDTELPVLKRFWTNYSCSQSLYSVECVNMDLTDAQDFITLILNAPEVKTVRFRNCIVSKSIGYFLSLEEDNGYFDKKDLGDNRDKEIRFNQCTFNDIIQRSDVKAFGRGLAQIRGLSGVLLLNSTFVDRKVHHMMHFSLENELPDEVTMALR